MRIPNKPAGKPPFKPKVKIVKVERLDEEGNSLAPPEYEYWVVDQKIPPTVLAILPSVNDAIGWILINGYTPA